MTNNEAVLRDALIELRALVWAECPSLLDEDSGGVSRLDMKICEILATSVSIEKAHEWGMPPPPRGWKLIPMRLFVDAVMLIDPPPTEVEGRIMVFKNPMAAEILTKLSKIIRAMTDATPPLPIPKAQVAQQEPANVEYELHQGDMMVAGTCGESAWREIQHYASQYEQDGPVQIYKVTRELVAAPQPIPQDQPKEQS